MSNRDLYRGTVTLETGKRVSVYGKTPDEVVEKLAAHKAHKTPILEPNKVTLGEWLDEWLELYAKPKVRQSTYDSYEIMSRVHIKPALGDVRVQKLTFAQIQRLYNKKAGEVSARTVNYIHAVLNMALRKAEETGIIPKNPCAHTVPPKMERKPIDPLNPEEFRKLMDAAKNHRYYPAILLEWSTGMRRGEILGLRWHDIDFKKNTIRVQQNVTRTSEGIGVSDVKTKTARRAIPVPPAVIAELKRHKTRQDAERLKHGLTWASDLVFCGSGGRMLDPTSFARAISKIIKAAGVRDVTFHSMRHSHATMLLEAGVPLKVISERLGHARMNITADTYAHILETMQQQVVDKLDEMLK